jgi:hypothetical protein
MIELCDSKTPPRMKLGHVGDDVVGGAFGKNRKIFLPSTQYQNGQKRSANTRQRPRVCRLHLKARYSRSFPPKQPTVSGDVSPEVYMPQTANFLSPRVLQLMKRIEIEKDREKLAQLFLELNLKLNQHDQKVKKRAGGGRFRPRTTTSIDEQ